jgi:hypothetical protein
VKFRTICARGITPEYRGAEIGQDGRIYGSIAYFEHFEKMTVVGVELWGGITEYDFQHLEEVEVYA